MTRVHKINETHVVGRQTSGLDGTASRIDPWKFLSTALPNPLRLFFIVLFYPSRGRATASFRAFQINKPGIRRDRGPRTLRNPWSGCRKPASGYVTARKRIEVWQKRDQAWLDKGGQDYASLHAHRHAHGAPRAQTSRRVHAGRERIPYALWIGSTLAAIDPKVASIDSFMRTRQANHPISGEHPKGPAAESSRHSAGRISRRTCNKARKPWKTARGGETRENRESGTWPAKSKLRELFRFRSTFRCAMNRDYQSRAEGGSMVTFRTNSPRRVEMTHERVRFS